VYFNTVVYCELRFFYNSIHPVFHLLCVLLCNSIIVHWAVPFVLLFVRTCQYDCLISVPCYLWMDTHTTRSITSPLYASVCVKILWWWFSILWTWYGDGAVSVFLWVVATAVRWLMENKVSKGSIYSMHFMYGLDMYWLFFATEESFVFISRCWSQAFCLLSLNYLKHSSSRPTFLLDKASHQVYLNIPLKVYDVSF